MLCHAFAGTKIGEAYDVSRDAAIALAEEAVSKARQPGLVGSALCWARSARQAVRRVHDKMFLRPFSLKGQTVQVLQNGLVNFCILGQ